MTPDEQRMIQDLFQRLASQGPVSKDPQADRVISDSLRANRDAGYMLVQTALVYEHQMEEQELRIRDLEDRIAQLQQDRAQQAPQAGGGSFLGGRIGSARSGSVPGVVSREPAPSSSPWSQAPQAAPQRGGMFGGGQPQQPQAYQQPMQAAPQGGGFFRSALQTAAGVAGGMMVANSLSGLFGGGGSAHAAGHATDNSGAFRDADATQDELQDAQIESDAEQDDAQDASYDGGGDAGGWDGVET